MSILGLSACTERAPTPAPSPTPSPAPTLVSIPTPTVINTGIVEIRVTDAPPEYISNIMVTLTNIEVHKADSDENSWISVVDGEKTFDLVVIQGAEEFLGQKEIEAGQYTQIRLDVTKVVVTLDGEEIDAKLPSGKIEVVRPWVIEPDSKTILTLDFEANKFVVITGQNSAQVEPVIELEVTKGDRPLKTTEPTTESEPTDNPEPTPTLPEDVKAPFHKYQELALFALELINRDRVANGLNPVVLGSNIASQNHAEERLTNEYSSHWGMDGLKPYMRYTLAGGVNNEGENVLGTGKLGSGGGAPSNMRDPKEMLEQGQEKLMDSPGHRANILNKWHKKVNLGIAYDNESLHLVQQFEGDYIAFSEFPSISSNIFSMISNVTIGNIKKITLYYDPLPQPLSLEQLNAPPYDSPYSLGEEKGNILPPLPPGSYYTNLSPKDVVAMIWEIRPDSSFTVEADISPILEEGNGVYTVVVWVETGGEFVGISNYSIFVQ